MPGPALVKVVAVALLAITELMVRPPLVLFWITTRSLSVFEPANVSPVMVETLPPTVLVTRIPPAPIMLVPAASVTVLAALVLKRKVLGVITPNKRPSLLLTSMLALA